MSFRTAPSSLAMSATYSSAPPRASYMHSPLKQGRTLSNIMEGQGHEVSQDLSLARFEHCQVHVSVLVHRPTDG